MLYHSRIAGVSTIRDGPYSHPLSTIITGCVFLILGFIGAILAILLGIFYVFCRKEQYCIPLLAPIILGSFGPCLLFAGIILCISGVKQFSRVRRMMKLSSQFADTKSKVDDDLSIGSLPRSSATSTSIEPIIVNENKCKQGSHDLHCTRNATNG